MFHVRIPLVQPLSRPEAEELYVVLGKALHKQQEGDSDEEHTDTSRNAG